MSIPCLFLQAWCAVISQPGISIKYIQLLLSISSAGSLSLLFETVLFQTNLVESITNVLYLHMYIYI